MEKLPSKGVENQAPTLESEIVGKEALYYARVVRQIAEESMCPLELALDIFVASQGARHSQKVSLSDAVGSGLKRTAARKEFEGRRT